MWKLGRQNSGYLKIRVFCFSFKSFGMDCYLLKYPEGSFIPPHKDPIDNHKHYRLNIVLKKAKKGGNLYHNNVKYKESRVVFFRPDIITHSVDKIVSGNRYVLSIGFAKRANK